MADLNFGSFEEMFNHFGGVGQSDLVNMSNILEVAEEQSRELFRLISDNLSSYFASYTPSVYERTGFLEESLKISPPEIDGNMVSFGVYFDPTFALHPSLWGGEMGNIALLLDTGWNINWSRPDRVPYLSDFLPDMNTGTHYLRDAVAQFNEINPYHFVANIVVDGSLWNPE